MSKMVNGRKRRGAFVAASEAVGGWRKNHKEVKEEEDDYVATTTPKRRQARRRCRGSKRALPSDQEQECKVVEVLTELVSLTDLLYSILPDYSDDEGTARDKKRCRVTTADDDHETAATSSSSGTEAPHEDYSEDEGWSQQLESETPYADDEDSESAAFDEFQETKPLPENDHDDEASMSSGDEHHEGNDYDDHFEASTSADEGSGRLWEAGDDHAVYASSDCCMVDDNRGQDDGEELDVGETIGTTPASLDLLESDFGLITARYESDGGYVGEQATLFLPWAFVVESSSASSMMSLDPTTTTPCDDAFWSLCDEVTDDSTSWLSSLSLLSVPPVAPAMPMWLACEEELSDELSTEQPPSCAGVVETSSLAAADSWLNSVFV
jgi:hypothetical protein